MLEKPEKTDLLVTINRPKLQMVPLIIYCSDFTSTHSYQGLSDPAPEAFDLDNKNAMALAIVPVGNVSEKQ